MNGSENKEKRNNSDHTYCTDSKSKDNVLTKSKKGIASKKKTGNKSTSSNNQVSGTTSKTKKIKSSKDLQTQNQMVEKRYKSKIEEGDGVYSCRNCKSSFVSHIYAFDHVKTPFCKQKKKKKEAKVKKCIEEGCDRSFLFSKDLKKHKFECHKETFECPDCKTNFKFKYNYKRHLLECRKVGKTFECSKCDYITFRKDTLETHEIVQHSPVEEHLSNVSQRPKPHLSICSVLSDTMIAIGSGNKVEVFSLEAPYCASFKSFGSKTFNFQIKSFDNYDCYLSIVGENQYDCVKLICNDDILSFEEVKKEVFSEKIISSSFLSLDIVFLFEKSIVIQNLFEPQKKEIISSSELIDMTVAGVNTDLVFVLDENGFIFYDNVRKLASENLRFHKFVENFQNNSANSLFYSQTLESLYVGHKDQTYSKFTRIPDSDATRETFGDVVNIEVFL